MKKLILTLALIAAPALSPAQKISEILFNPPSTDAPNEFVEIIGTPSATLPAGTYLVFIEGDTTGAGDIQNIFDLSGLAFGSNGYLVLRQGSSAYTVDVNATDIVGAGTGWTGVAGWSSDSSTTDIENASMTALLIQTATAPALTDDIDAANDGIIDAPFSTNWTILDGVAVVDNAGDCGYAGLIYSTAATIAGNPVGAEIVVTTATANYITRQNGTTTTTSADFVAGGLEGTAPNFTRAAGDTYPSSMAGGVMTGNVGSANPAASVSDWSSFDF
ncbi:hypothetical protein GC173_18025 [bacterium]|nr:hypothetical protein [bacterium]